MANISRIPSLSPLRPIKSPLGPVSQGKCTSSNSPSSLVLRSGSFVSTTFSATTLDALSPAPPETVFSDCSGDDGATNITLSNFTYKIILPDTFYNLTSYSFFFAKIGSTFYCMTCGRPEFLSNRSALASLSTAASPNLRTAPTTALFASRSEPIIIGDTTTDVSVSSVL